MPVETIDPAAVICPICRTPAIRVEEHTVPRIEGTRYLGWDVHVRQWIHEGVKGVCTMPVGVSFPGHPPAPPPPAPRLCYVSGCWAFFTTRQPFTAQWGDDWNDAPYEGNAGDPYEWRADMDAEADRWTITRVAWTGNFETPDEGPPHQARHFSVEQINAGVCPWLREERLRKNPGPGVIIPAGTTLPDFIMKVASVGGQVYLPTVQGRPAC